MPFVCASRRSPHHRVDRDDVLRGLGRCGVDQPDRRDIGVAVEHGRLAIDIGDELVDSGRQLRVVLPVEVDEVGDAAGDLFQREVGRHAVDLANLPVGGLVGALEIECQLFIELLARPHPGVDDINVLARVAGHEAG